MPSRSSAASSMKLCVKICDFYLFWIGRIRRCLEPLNDAGQLIRVSSFSLSNDPYLPLSGGISALASHPPFTRR